MPLGCYAIAMFGNFFMKMMFQRQLKGLPKDVQEAMTKALDEHPEFFEKLVADIAAKVKAGVPQMNAVQQVMMSKRAELQKILSK